MSRSQSRRAGGGRGASSDGHGLRAELGALDFTLLVIGAVVGADVYVVAAMGAAFLGPAQLVAWVAAGVLAALISLAFVQCAAIQPRVGGTYAYARAAFGPIVGFFAGWSLYLGEWIALPVFPIAFGNYLAYLLPGAAPIVLVLAEVALVGAVTAVNFVGVGMGARVNDALTLGKLVPLALLIVAACAFLVAQPTAALAQLAPFAPLGWSGFGSALVLIFWAYAGFELAVLPAAEVRDPQRTLPLGLFLGMGIATLFYLLVSGAVVLALPYQDAARSSRPLADALERLFDGLGLPAGIGPTIMSLGALISIAGVYLVFTLSLARLSYAMAADGLFPAAFARLEGRYRTPYLGLLFQALSALLGVVFFGLQSLIGLAVFFLGICYALTALAALRLVGRAPDRRLHLPALRPLLALSVAGGAFLSTQVPLALAAVGLGAIGAGFALYALRRGSWQRAADELRATVEVEEHRLTEWAARRERWLLAAARRYERGRGSG